MSSQNPSGVFQAIHDIKVEDRSKPEITPNSVIIRVDKTGICGTDLHIYHEGLVPPGSVLGHEFSGEIIEVGNQVSDLKTGTRAVVNPMYNGVGLGLAPGGFAHYVRIDNAQKGKNVIPIPDALDAQMGALVEPLSVGVAAVNASPFKASDNVLVTGCGTIGLVTIASLKSKGVDNIIASDISEKRLELAKQLGAKYTFNPKSDGALKDYLAEKFGTVPSLNYAGDLPNLNGVYECSGVSAIFIETLKSLAPDGHLTSIAIYSKPVEIDPNDIVYKRARVNGSLFYTDADFTEAIDLLATGKVDLSAIVTHTFPLNELPEAFKTQADSSVSVKVMVESNG